MSDQNEVNEFEEPTKLESVFATTATGEILEIPSSEVGRFAVSDSRMEELGHSPLVPYDKLVDAVGCVEDPEEHVEGRHMLPGSETSAGGATLGWNWHRGWEFGAFQGPDGSFYTGIHRHPHGDQRAVPADPSEFS